MSSTPERDSAMITSSPAVSDQQRQRLGLGLAAVVLPLASVLVIGVSAPWQVRFPVVAVTALFGPMMPALRLHVRLSLEQCLVYGLGANVALEMVLGLALVLFHGWIPTAAFLCVLVITFAIGARLVYDAVIGSER
jgi:hypothetical protein